jgi:hypothetical protein
MTCRSKAVARVCKIVLIFLQELRSFEGGAVCVYQIDVETRFRTELAEIVIGTSEGGAKQSSARPYEGNWSAKSGC